MYKFNQTGIRIIAITFTAIIVLKLCLIFLWPLMAAFIIVLSLEPVVKFLQHIGTSRRVAVILSYLSAALFIFLFVTLLTKSLLKQLDPMLQNYTSILQDVEQRFSFIPVGSLKLHTIAEKLRIFLLSGDARISKAIGDAFNSMFDIVAILLFSILASLDMERLQKNLKMFINRYLILLFSRVCNKLGMIIILELELVLVTALMTVAGLYVLGINNALTIGMICGILDLLPIVGPAVIFIPLVISEYLTGAVFTGTGLIVLFVLLQVSREVMKLLLVGDRLSMRPLPAMVCIYYGMYLYGLPGLFLGPALGVIILEIYHEQTGRSSITEL